jgi:CRISPR-associated protein Cmr2
MSLDYYAFQKSKMNSALSNLEEAAGELEQAKKIKDKETKKQAVEKAHGKMKQAAGAIAKVEPHLAYLWYEVLSSNLKDSVRDAWQKRLSVAENPWRQGHFDFRKIPDDFGFTPDPSAVASLPPFSFILQVPFRLHKPYLSKDERDFYLLDNPLRREKVFKTPMVAAPGWKGALRAAMVPERAVVYMIEEEF